MERSIGVVKRLILAKRRRDKRIRMIDTALMVALRRNNKAMVKFVLGKGANINVPDLAGDYPIHMAVKWGSQSIVNLLLKFGANVFVLDAENRTVVHLAIANRNELMAKMFIHMGVAINAGRCDYYCLRGAFGIGNLEIIQALLKAGADVNVIDPQGSPLFHAVVMVSGINVVRMMIDFNVDVNIQNSNGLTALHLAALRAKDSMIELLVNNGANLRMIDNFSFTPLHYATFNGHASTVKLLLNFNPAIVNDTVTNGSLAGSTALHFAAKEGYCECIDILAANGAQIDARNNSGWTPLYLATLKALRLTDENMDHKNAVKRLLDYGADVNEPTKVGRSVLEVPAARGDIEMNRVLLRHIAELEAKGMYVSCITTKSIEKSAELQDYYDKCKTELSIMKKSKIFGTVSFLQLLTKNSNALIAYARNKEIVDAFVNSDFVARFPCHSEELKLRFQKAIDRQQLIEETTTLLSSLVLNFAGLHQQIKEKILNNLTNEELRALTRDNKERRIADL